MVKDIYNNKTIQMKEEITIPSYGFYILKMSPVQEKENEFDIPAFIRKKIKEK